MESYHTEKGMIESREAFDQLMSFVEDNASTMEAYSMEKGIFQRILQIGLKAMQTYFEQKGPGDKGKEVVNIEGDLISRERERNTPYFTIFGELKLSRYCYREIGVESIYPLDEEANLPERKFSYFLQEIMCYHSMSRPFRAVCEHFLTYFGHSFSPRTVENVNREFARSYDSYYEEREKLTHDEAEIHAVSFDGKGVPVVKKELSEDKGRLKKGEKRQKKKEALVGVSYSVDRTIRQAEDVADNLVFPSRAKSSKTSQPPPPRSQNKHFIASICKPKQEVMELIKEDMEARNPGNTRPLVCLLDGARSLWHGARRTFPGALFILDIIHVLEYLWEVSSIYHKEGSEEARKWVRDKLLKILQGNVGSVIKGLKITRSRRKLTASKKKTLTKVITYYSRNRKGMKYNEYLKQGFPIGTGVVESACGHIVKDRMEGSGMRWTLRGAEGMLQLRSLKASNDWEDYIQFHTQEEKSRLYWGMKYWQIPVKQEVELKLVA